MTQRVWNEIENVVKKKRLKERMVPTLADAAFGYRFRRSHYVLQAEVSEQVASRDLKIMIDHGLLVGEGETKGRIYRASPKLYEIYLRNYEKRTNPDPFAQETLPFPVESTTP